MDLIQLDKVFISESQNLKWEDQHIKYGENSWQFLKILDFYFDPKIYFVYFSDHEMREKFTKKQWMKREKIVVWLYNPTIKENSMSTGFIR